MDENMKKCPYSEADTSCSYKKGGCAISPADRIMKKGHCYQLKSPAEIRAESFEAGRKAERERIEKELKIAGVTHIDNYPEWIKQTFKRFRSNKP